MLTDRFARSTWWLAAGGVLACGGGDQGREVSVRDSLGITVVESRSPGWSDRESWTISSEPVLEIGAADGPPESQFFRVEGALHLDDGRIVVADAGSSEIRFFGEDGRFAGATGRQGEAPGEYRQITALGRGPGDSLWVYDFGLRRFTVLTAEGEAVRTVSVGTTLSAVEAVGRLADGSFVVRESWSSTIHNTPRVGLVRDPVAVVRLAPDGSRADTIATVAGREVFLSTENGRGVMSAPLFAHTSSAAIRSAFLFVGDQEAVEILQYAGDGTLARIVRRLDVDLRLSPTAIAAEMEFRLRDEPAERRAMARASLEALALPATRPAYGRIEVDAAGNLWVAEHPVGSDVPRSWTVFGPGGELLGQVEMPPDFRVLDIGRDHILGVGRDAFDVEYVRMYRLDKPSIR